MSGGLAVMSRRRPAAHEAHARGGSWKSRSMTVLRPSACARLTASSQSRRTMSERTGATPPEVFMPD